MWAAIIGGLLISLLGGSRHQIGGPTGAFVPVLAAVLFLRRMEGVTQVRLLTAENDTETGANAVRGKDVPPGVVLFRFEGPLFFAAAEKLEFALRAHTGKPRIIILRMRHGPMMDATGMKALEVAWEKNEPGRRERARDSHPAAADEGDVRVRSRGSHRHG